jgi:hypothetical protein
VNLFQKSRRKTNILVAAAAISIVVAGGYLAYVNFFKVKMMPASISPYNFTDIGIGDLYVNGTWGGNSYPHKGGGGSVCCVSIPEKWRPGLVVNIKWIRSDLSENWYSAEAEIPKYVESGSLQVLFLDNDKVKVYVNDYWPCTPMHPMPKEELCKEKAKP